LELVVLYNPEKVAANIIPAKLITNPNTLMRQKILPIRHLYFISINNGIDPKFRFLLKITGKLTYRKISYSINSNFIPYRKISFRLPKFNIESEYKRSDFQEESNQHLYPKGICSSAFKKAWDAEFTGKDVLVAVVDTGIDSTHPDLKDKVIKSINLTGEPLQESHGTYVAGIIAGNGWLYGGAPDASLNQLISLGNLFKRFMELM